MQESQDLCEGTERFPVFLHDRQRAKILKTFKYVPCNIPGPGTSYEDFQTLLAGCECMDTCTDCACVSRFGPNYDQSGGILPPLLSPDSNKLVVECNTNCSCPRTCCNRVVQNGIPVQLKLFETESKGFGLCTQESIPAFNFVCEYAGEVLTEHEASQRVQHKTRQEMNYLLVLQEFCSTGVIRTLVDPEIIGNIGRFINHSCDPNLIMVPVRVSNNVPKLALFACRDIGPGEELCYDYSGRNCGQTDVREESSKHRWKKVCKCGSAKCRGLLPIDESLFK
ncbi:histone-lysine N-methyltransferase SETMAR-like [Gigantopelta aegis]|uniref:histone-lysine N-methyltransferase SETMAR-like n=1 Tax=Gigantopelta aegis TaxID=1735272 RepID=UPI001B88BF36|nr:histone-lysine N-methyltransferase SETMAR-like [Gigantopelta aegis]